MRPRHIPLRSRHRCCGPRVTFRVFYPIGDLRWGAVVGGDSTMAMWYVPLPLQAYLHILYMLPALAALVMAAANHGFSRGYESYIL